MVGTADTRPARSPKLGRKPAVLAGILGGVSAQFASGMAAVLALVVIALTRGLDPKTPEHMEELMTDPLVIVFGASAVALTLSLTALLTPWLTRVSLRESLGLNLPPPWTWLVACLAVPGVSTIGDAFSTALASVAPNFTLGTLESFAALGKTAPLWMLLPSLALLPGLGEELFFRGMLQRAFGNSYRAVLGVALVFSLYHVDPHHAVGTLPIGMYLGFLALRANSTLLAMGVHAFNNALAFVLLRFDWLNFGYGTDRPVPWWWVAGSLTLAALAIVGVVKLTSTVQRSARD